MNTLVVLYRITEHVTASLLRGTAAYNTRISVCRGVHRRFKVMTPSSFAHVDIIL